MYCVDLFFVQCQRWEDEEEFDGVAGEVRTVDTHNALSCSTGSQIVFFLGGVLASQLITRLLNPVSPGPFH